MKGPKLAMKAPKLAMKGPKLAMKAEKLAYLPKGPKLAMKGPQLAMKADELADLPKGWQTFLSPRKTGDSKGKVDRYFIAPDMKILRSWPQVQEYLGRR